MKKETILLLTAAFLIGQASATVFGTFQYSEEKKTAGEPVEYRIGMVNLGQSSLKVNVETSNAEKVSLNLDEEITLKPSKTSSTPGKGKWYYLGNGTYAEIKVYTFDAAARNFRNWSFQLTLKAYSKNNNSESGFQNIIQERSYRFTLVNSTYSEGLVNFKSDKKKEAENGTDEMKGGNLTITDPGDTNSTEKTVRPEKESKSQGLTLVLGFGALLSLTYLVKVMLL